ncbi:hypothetical protein L4L00_001080 [Salmonella enterica]|nr:hypothetical protein [Salmonella enterica]EIT0241031.1 hypothetical protein [Salmonella enterica]EIU2258477.1 hypothetical protein [Salmonella enterica]EIU2428316.1 hypothetical protein [Salmonella enterica]
MSRVPPQRRGAARETAVPLTPRRQYAGGHKAQATARQGGAAGTAAASQPLASWDGSPSGRRRFTGSVHDSPPGRPWCRHGYPRPTPPLEEHRSYHVVRHLYARQVS